jgi:hypothetical protein
LSVLALAGLGACSGRSGSGGALAIFPPSAEVDPADTARFDATSGTQSADPVEWSVAESGGGSIDSTGRYTAPDVEGTFHVVASSSTLRQVATVRVVKKGIRVTVSPAAATIATGTTLTLDAKVTGTSNGAVTWSVAEAGGGSVADGVYVAPAVAGVYHVVATSTDNPARSDFATVTVVDAQPAPVPPPAIVAVSVTPTSASVDTGATAQFTASVTGTSDVGVTWSVQEGAAGGTVSATGLYTAPGTAGTYHAVATSQADPSKTATATVTVNAPAPPPPPPTGTPPTAAGANLYIAPAPAGSDSNPGTAAQPFATLERARTAVQAVKASGLPAGGVTVWIRGGVYERTATFTLGSADSGTATSRITYKAYPGETPRLVGGKALDPSWWSLVTSADSRWSRLSAAARGKVYKIALGARGLSGFGAYATRGGNWRPSIDFTWAAELFFNGSRQTVARWPNLGARATGIADGQAISSGGTAYTVDWSGGTLPANLATAVSRGEAYCTGVPNGWSGLTARVTSVSGGTLTIQRDDGGGWLTGTGYWYQDFLHGNPFFVHNVLEHLDSPGEYWLDTASGDLYFWPPSALDLGTATVSMLTTPLVSINGASYVTLDGLTIEAGRGDLVRITSGSSNLVQASTLRNAGRAAVRIYAGTSGNGVLGGEIAYSGDEAVRLDGSGNYVRNADIHHATQLAVNQYFPAISIWGNGNTVANNAIHDCQDQAIKFHDNNHVIEKNDISRTNWYSSDSGVIYAVTSVNPGTGNVIRYNYIHDVYNWWAQNNLHWAPWPYSDGDNNGIYLDDNWADALVQGNVIRNISHHCIMHGGGGNAGPRVVIQDNILEGCGNGYSLAERAAYNASVRSYGGMPYGSMFRRNTLGLNNAEIVNGWLERVVPYFQDYSGNVGNPYQGSLYGVDPQWVDPNDPKKGLKASSPVLSIPGWQPIPFSQIGIQP